MRAMWTMAMLTLTAPMYAQPKENPAASQLLAEARAARAVWPKFPGFKAVIEVTHNNATSVGKVAVDAKGKVVIDGLDENVNAWAKRNLSSTVQHRLESASSLKTPCAFADDHMNHPLGQKILVLNDELHSSYRIKDRQINEVNRTMGDRRFTISVLENRLSADKKFLSVSYVVDFWDAKSGELVLSEAHHQDWARVGAFDLPTTTLVVASKKGESAGEDGRDIYRLTLSQHQLAKQAPSGQ